MGKHKPLSIGVYPDISLRKARDLHHQAKRLLADGIDPTQKKQLEKSLKIEQSQNSFKAIALEWIERQRPTCLLTLKQ